MENRKRYAGKKSGNTTISHLAIPLAFDTLLIEQAYL